MIGLMDAVVMSLLLHEFYGKVISLSQPILPLVNQRLCELLDGDSSWASLVQEGLTVSRTHLILGLMYHILSRGTDKMYKISTRLLGELVPAGGS